MKKKAETKNSRLALQASEIRYRRLFETAQDGILILNAETGQIDDVNPYMIDMLQYSHEEFIGKKLWEVSPFKDTVLNQTAFEELQDKGYIRYNDLPLETKEGKPVAVEFISNIYQANGNKVIQCNIRNITERKEEGQKLKEAIVFQQRLIDALPLPVFYMDSEGRYLGSNSSFEKFFGQKREQTNGKSIYELFPKEIADLYHEKNLALLQNPGIQIYETTVKDGRDDVRHVIFHKATFPNWDGSVGGLIGGILDITDRKQAEEKYRSIFENAQEGIFRSTPDGRIIMANRAMAEIFGYESPEKMMTSITDVIPQHYVNPEDRRKLIEMIEEHDLIKRHEVQYYKKDGSIVMISMTMHAVRDEKGEIMYYDGIIEDITSRKEAEEELRQAYLVLHETNEQLIQADKLAAVGILSAGVAHEILNPLNIIAVGIASLETTQDLSATVKEAFAIFQRQVDRVVRIAQDLQQFSRKSAKETEVTDLRELMQDTLTMCEPRFKVERLHVEVDYDDTIPGISLDRHRMEQVFLNIINNAIDAMADIENKELHIKTKSLRDEGGQADRVLIVFSDCGQGIRLEDLEHLFDPFFTTKTVGKGTGLGLSISHGIVQNHGGRIWAKNNPEGGAAFYIELPLTAARNRRNKIK